METLLAAAPNIPRDGVAVDAFSAHEHCTLRNKVAIAHLIRCAGRVPYSTPLFGVLSTLLIVV